jgi:hypothetical protein
VSDIGAAAPILHSTMHSVLAQIEDAEPLNSASNPARRMFDASNVRTPHADAIIDA